jgi:Sulfotransferase family
MGAFTPIESAIKQFVSIGSWRTSMLVASVSEPSAVEFYRKFAAGAFVPDKLIRVLPDLDVIYLVVPKVANTRIRTILAAISGRLSRRLRPSDQGKFRDPKGPRSISVRSFYRLATSPTTFRFSFVRNPYTRLLSCWADKFQGKPLVQGSPEIDDYLARRERIDRGLPFGADQTLSFERFASFAAASLTMDHDLHLHRQDDLLSVPGIALDFIGRLESFDADFAKVLDRLDAGEEIRRQALVPLNTSQHQQCSKHYTPGLADKIYRAYERDFDRFGYPRALPN